MIVTIKRLGHLGDGVAMGPNGPIYVPQALPGEVIEGIFDGQRLRAIRIVTPSPARVKAPCKHARNCGGCVMQNVSNTLVADWKQEMIRSALAVHGITATMRAFATSPTRSRRRATLAGRRTRSGAIIGFHARGSEALVEIPECILLDKALIAVIPALTKIVIAGASRTSELAMSITRSESGPDVAVSGGKPLDAALRASLAAVAEAHGLARLTWDSELIVLRNPPVQIFGGISVVPPPGSFLQATDHGEEQLRAAVTEGVNGARRVIDLFAGCGTFALPLARKAEVHAVEGEPTMIAALDLGWRSAHGLRRVSTEVRDLFRRPLDASEMRGFDAVVINPPRAGAEAQTAALSKSGMPIVVYVSCDPVTFARDAKRLVQAGYRIDWVQGVDQFRWAAHVELVACFSR